MRARILAVAVLCTLFLATRVGAAEPYAVAIEVRADNKDLRSRLESSLRKELRLHPDLVVADEGPRHFEILLIAVGDYSEFSIAAVAVEIGACLTTSHSETVALRVLCDANVLAGSGGDQLREATASTVASFDTRCVERARKVSR